MISYVTLVIISLIHEAWIYLKILNTTGRLNSNRFIFVTVDPEEDNP